MLFIKFCQLTILILFVVGFLYGLQLYLKTLTSYLIQVYTNLKNLSTACTANAME